MYCRQHLAENYKKMYEIWRQRNPLHLDAKKLLNQKNYIMKHKKLTENKIEKIKKDMQANEESPRKKKRRRTRTSRAHNG